MGEAKIESSTVIHDVVESHDRPHPEGTGDTEEQEEESRPFCKYRTLTNINSEHNLDI